MQNERVLISSLMLGFRAHTRVLATLTVAMIIACLCLRGSTLPHASVLAKLAVQSASQPELPVQQTQPALPGMVIRFFFLLPHLLPHDN